MWKLSSLSFLGQTHGTRKSSEPHTDHKPLMDIGERVLITLANISPGETFFYFRAANNKIFSGFSLDYKMICFDSRHIEEEKVSH